MYSTSVAQTVLAMIKHHWNSPLEVPFSVRKWEMENEKFQIEITDYTLPHQKWNASWRNKMKYIRFEMVNFIQSEIHQIWDDQFLVVKQPLRGQQIRSGSKIKNTIPRLKLMHWRSSGPFQYFYHYCNLKFAHSWHCSYFWVAHRDSSQVIDFVAGR